jgi:hypothetical protein
MVLMSDKETSFKKLRKLKLVKELAEANIGACNNIINTYIKDRNRGTARLLQRYSKEMNEEANITRDLCREIVEDMEKAIETLEEDPRQNAALDRKSSVDPKAATVTPEDVPYVVLMRQRYNSGSISLIKECNTGLYLVQVYDSSGGLEYTRTFSSLTDAKYYYFDLIYK